MHFTPGIVTLAAASGLAAAVGTMLLIGSARRPDRTYRLLAVGAAVALPSLATGLIWLVAPAGWGQSGAMRVAVAAVVAAGMSLSALLGCVNLLRLPGVAESGAVALRLILDALILATALWFVGWVMVSAPTRLFGALVPGACRVVLMPTVTAATTVGLVCIIIARAGRPRGRLVRLGLGVAATAVGGLGLAAGLCQLGPGLALTGAVLLAGGLVSCGFVTRGTEPLPVDASDVRRDGGYSFAPMLAMAVSAMYHLLRGGDFDLPGVVAGSAEGFLLVARQYLALHDVRGYARRLAEREAHFRELAHTDPLTGLANRRGLMRALHQAVGGSAPSVLLGLDLDGFKNVNDARGHDVGDAVLAEVGQRLRSNIRPGDVAARLGGDEFAVLMRVRQAEAQRVAERMLGVLSRPYQQPDGPIFLSVSIGLAGGAAEPDVDVLLRNADLALRYAKQRGKNRVERYDVAYDRLLRRRTKVEHALRGAVERGELSLAFQPVVAVPSVRPVGAEALLRWRHPELGNVRPDEFIPLAEECGMIGELGAWVLHEACHQLSRWLAEGHDVWLSVNVSPRELHAASYVSQVTDALRAHHVPPQRLVLEITEHAVATDVDELIRRLTALRLTGVRIALDDFGAGYSSLGQLRRLPIDILKIDHSLVAEHEPIRPVDRDGPAFAPMVDVVMRLGHQLGLEVIAEGVTNPTELAAVVAAGCRFGQGQLFGWGVPAEHLEAMLEAATSPGARALSSPPPQHRPGDVGTVAHQAVRSTDEDGTGGRMIPDVQDVRSVDSSREMRQA